MEAPGQGSWFRDTFVVPNEKGYWACVTTVYLLSAGPWDGIGDMGAAGRERGVVLVVVVKREPNNRMTSI